MSKNKDTRVEMIKCACGCGEMLNKYDGNYRTRTVINGHNNRKYDDPKEYKRVYIEKTKESRRSERTAVKKERRARYRDILLKRRGSQCVHCGIKYDGKNSAMFDFHHVDSSNKLFEVSSNASQNHSIEEVLLESDKCVILCANCHRLHHHTDQVPINKEILNEQKNSNERGSAV